MAKDFKTDKQTISRVLKKDLKKKCYRKRKVQKLKANHKSKRKTCCTWMRKNIKRDDLKKFMFTDEKVFTTNGYFNPKNDVVWADSRSDADKELGRFEQEKFPISIMVALGATWNGLTSPYFFSKGERLNTKSYANVLKFYKKRR